MLKSIAKPSDIDYVMIEEDPDEREEFIRILESRFFYLAADARSSLRLIYYCHVITAYFVIVCEVTARFYNMLVEVGNKM